MARPKKQGLDYFTCDVNMYQDIKIRKLIRYKGVQAVSVYQILLCQIYAVGYYLKWDDDLPFIISEVSDLQEDYINDVISYALSIGLFDQTVYDENKVLTSHGIQERFFDFCSVAKRKVSSDTPYLLVDLKGKSVISSKKDVISEQTVVFPEETIVNPEETQINSEISTQSKVKESKDNNSLRSSLSPFPPSTTSSARESEGEQEEKEDIPMTAKEGVELLKKDRDWLLQMQRKFGIESGVLVRWLDSFVVDCDCRGKQEHESMSDIKQHFNDWMTKANKSSGKKKSGKPTSPLSPQQRWISCIAELSHSVGEDVSLKSFDTVKFLNFDDSLSELHIQVPNKETYDYMEQNLVHTMTSIMPKYFGDNVQLKYHLP